MKIQIETDNYQDLQILNFLKKLGINFTVERDNSHDFVDLGLPSGLKWATCNVGAKTPTECGNYFRWGEVADVREISDSDYDYDKPFEDAATYYMGSAWRMPTTDEIQELYDNTTNKWIKNYQGTGINGCLFISKVNDQTLFFPATGYYGGSSRYYVGSVGYVWSSSIGTSYPYPTPYLARYLHFSSSEVDTQKSYGRRYGLSVRGVRY